MDKKQVLDSPMTFLIKDVASWHFHSWFQKSSFVTMHKRSQTDLFRVQTGTADFTMERPATALHEPALLWSTCSSSQTGDWQGDSLGSAFTTEVTLGHMLRSCHIGITAEMQASYQKILIETKLYSYSSHTIDSIM